MKEQNKDFLKSELTEARQLIQDKTGISLESWREVFNYGSAEWDHSLESDKKIIIDTIKGPENPLRFSLSTLIKMYKELNQLLDKPFLNKGIDLSLTLCLDPGIFKSV